MKDQVKTLRMKLNLTQTELAEIVGVCSQVVVSRWETGERELGEPLRRFFSWINSLSKKEAMSVLKKMKRRGRK